MKPLPKYAYDVETYPNFFCMVVEELHPELLGQWWYFEISARRNDIKEIYKFFYRQPMFLFSFNGVHFDNPILHLIIKGYHYYESHPTQEVIVTIMKLVDALISNEYDRYKEHKYIPKQSLYYDPVDIFLFWTRLIRMSKHVSLKALEVAIEHHNVQELPIAPNSLIEVDQMDDIKWYCKNDVEATIGIAFKLKDEFNLKRRIREIYHIPNTLISDDVNIGINILLNYYLMENPHLDRQQVIEMRTYHGNIHFKDIILPIIKFQTPAFQDVLDEWRTVEIPERGKFNRSVHFKGKRYDIGLGGLHTKDEAVIISPKEDEFYSACDVRSYYPNLLMSWDWYPRHLGPSLLKVYKNIYERRIAAKAQGDKVTDKSLKLTLNGYTGMLKNEYSWVLDRAVNMKITVNGQLLLCMLAEDFELNGFDVVSANTDGLEIIGKKTRYQEYLDICEKWEKIAKVELEHEAYKMMVRRDVNSYLAIYNKIDPKTGKLKVKEKGFFRTTPPLEDARNFLIIPKALMAHFRDGVRIEDFIRNHENFFDFCTYPRMSREYTVYSGEKELPQRGNRVFISKHGKPLFKVNKETSKRASLLKGHKMMLGNKYTEHLIDYVDRQAYINKTYKYLSKYSQPSLFN